MGFKREKRKEREKDRRIVASTMIPFVQIMKRDCRC